jgi:ribonuclease D
MSEARKRSIRSQAEWRGKYRSRSHDAAHAGEQADAAHPERDGVPSGGPQVVATPAELAALVETLRAAGSFAFDSEFIGEMSYVPQLCLIQVATPQGIALVDPLADLDLSSFWQLLLDPAIQKIVHSGHQDVEPVLRIFGRPAQNVVDTQIAAGFVGLCYPCSLLRLVEEVLGIRLHKGLTFTDWSQRPLSSQQMKYAADDVRYLPAVWQALAARFPTADTARWLGEECAAMCAKPLYGFDPQTTYLRVRGAATLNATQLGMLRELVAWRDAAARHADLPPRALVKDEVLIDLCRHPARSADKLAGVRNLSRPVIQEYGQDILQALERGATQPIKPSPFPPREEELPNRQFRNDAIHAMALSLAHARGVDPALVATRADVAEFSAAVNSPERLERLPLYQSWRRELVGEPLREMLLGGRRFQFTWNEKGLAAE